MAYLIRSTDGKEIKEKQRNLKMAMSSKSPTKCFQITLIFFSYVGGFFSLKNLTVQILLYLNLIVQSLLLLVTISVVITLKGFVVFTL